MKYPIKYLLAIIILQLFFSCDKESDSFYESRYKFLRVNGLFVSVYEVNNLGYIISSKDMAEDKIILTNKYYYDKHSGILNSYTSAIDSYENTVYFNNKYDSDGRLISSDNFFYTYDNGRLSKLDKSFLYDINIQYYYYNEDGILITEIDSIENDVSENKFTIKKHYYYYPDGKLKSIIENIDEASEPSRSFHFNYLHNQLLTVKSTEGIINNTDSMIYDKSGRYLRLYIINTNNNGNNSIEEFEYPNDFPLKPIIHPRMDYEAYILGIPKNGFTTRTIRPTWDY